MDPGVDAMVDSAAAGSAQSLRSGWGPGLGRASRCGSGGPRPRRAPAGTARRTRGSRPPRRAVRPGRRPPRSGWRSRRPRRGRPRRCRRRCRWSAGRTGRRPAPARRTPDTSVGAVAEDAAPAELVHLPGPDAGAAGVLAAGGGVVAMVEHRADQHLRGDRRGAAVAGQQRDPGGQAAAGAGTGDDDAGRDRCRARRRARPSRAGPGSSRRPGSCRWPRAPAGSRRRPRRRRTGRAIPAGCRCCEKRSPMIIPPP